MLLITNNNMTFEIDENEMVDVEQDIYDYMEMYMENEIVKFSSPHFMEEFVEEITNTYHNYLLSCGVCDEEDYDDIEEIVESLSEVYFGFIDIPPRSICYDTIDNDYVIDYQGLSEQILKLKEIPQPKQKTPEWYSFRYNLITASNIYKALGSEAQRNSLIFEKCKPFSTVTVENFGCNTESTFHWGNKYEPLSVLVYEQLFQTKIDDFGCIQHPTYSFIGASPDGINTDIGSLRYGRMLEIKNICNREITGIPKEEYWIQTQLQMETCNLDLCDFFETRFKEFETEEQFHEDTDHDYKGVILYFVKNTNGMSLEEIATKAGSLNVPVYKYMPIDCSTEKDSIQLWIENMKKDNPDLILFSVLYWYLDEYSCVLIKRNREWFQAALPALQGTWDTIVKERVDGYQHRAAKKRAPTNTIVVKKLGSQECDPLVENITGPICLVKLD